MSHHHVYSELSNGSNLLKNAGVVTTLVDAAIAFAKGRRRSGLLLLGAGLLSRKIPGLGTAVSLLLRLYRRLR